MNIGQQIGTDALGRSVMLKADWRKKFGQKLPLRSFYPDDMDDINSLFDNLNGFYIWKISCGEILSFIKIGRAKDLRSRLISYHNTYQMVEKLQLLKTLVFQKAEDATDFEKQMKKELRAKKIVTSKDTNYEWYSATDEKAILAQFDELRKKLNKNKLVQDEPSIQTTDINQLARQGWRSQFSPTPSSSGASVKGPSTSTQNVTSKRSNKTAEPSTSKRSQKTSSAPAKIKQTARRR